jgi:hypothetical protein
MNLKISEKDLIGTRWYIKCHCVDLEDEVITLSNNNELICMGNPREVQAWQFEDHILELSFNNGYSIYRGTTDGELYYGSAENILGDKWGFEAFLIGNKSFPGCKSQKP